MARQNYPESERRVLLSEGGYTNNPRDPGGPTNWGITLADARLHWKPNATAEDVRTMPKSVAEGIYKSKYWDALHGDDLPSGVDYAVFDYGVNSGIGRAGRVLRATLGLPHSTALWHVDQSVLDALARVDPVKVVDAICTERLVFLRGLSTWDEFGKGWSRRVVGVKTYGDHLASMASHEAPAHPETPPHGKGYGDGSDVIVEPVNPSPGGNPTQEANKKPQGSPPVRLPDPSATPGAPQRKAHWWAPWAALGLGGSGAFDWFDQVSDAVSRVQDVSFDLSNLHIWDVLMWVLHHPLVLLPAVLVGLGAWLWEDHKETKRLIKELEQKQCSQPSSPSSPPSS